jgi:DNA sulfur modification protein DndB
MRNVVAHASSGVSLSVEQVTTLESYEQWLRQKAMSDDSDPAGTETNGDEEA